ncbi:hypothetical protein EDB85DRAFT_1288745 [Lactarius pseudohatsudake]|nr:hypothetical protein EDB85DRAFT_1288745 [Lactarius pseudohatsudake]
MKTISSKPALGKAYFVRLPTPVSAQRAFFLIFVFWLALRSSQISWCCMKKIGCNCLFYFDLAWTPTRKSATIAAFCTLSSDLLLVPLLEETHFLSHDNGACRLNDSVCDTILDERRVRIKVRPFKRSRKSERDVRSRAILVIYTHIVTQISIDFLSYGTLATSLPFKPPPYPQIVARIFGRDL